MNGFNLSDIQDARLGGTQLSAIYLGSSKLWSTAFDYSQEYFTIECLENNTSIYWWLSSSSGTAKTIQFSYDKETWYTETSSYISDSEGTLLDTLDDGDIIYIKGSEKTYADSSFYSAFMTLGTIKVSGNIMSMLYGDNFINQTTLTGIHTFNGLFRKCPYLLDASNLILPSTILTSYCYANMFRDCTSLLYAPKLPATTLAERCYYYMFHTTKSLTTPPILPAMTMQKYCYCYMFENSGITSISLPATTLAYACYANMLCSTKITTLELPATNIASFGRCYRTICYGCSSLTSVTIRATSSLASNCLDYAFYGCTNLSYIKYMSSTQPSASYTWSWVNNVKLSGAFVKNSSATWANSYGTSAIPSGWTVTTASE